MPWKQVEPMLQRKEFIEKLLLPEANVSALCEAYAISRKTAYKWLTRYNEHGLIGLKDKNKAPRHSPYKTDKKLEDRCYPLTIIDDYSRYSIGLDACQNERGETVKAHLIRCFKEFGLPQQINVDNGNPWGSADLDSYTTLAVWLMKCDVRLSHSSPYHPQTNGKDERFHRTLKLEVLHNKAYKSCSDIQHAFDEWRHIYNYKRPHHALNGKPPCYRYVESSRVLSDKPKLVEYDSSEIVRKVHTSGMIRFKGSRYRAGKGLSGEYVAIRETDQEDRYSIFFMDLFINKFTIDNRL